MFGTLKECYINFGLSYSPDLILDVAFWDTFVWFGVVVYVILVSAQGPNPSFVPFWGTFIQFGGLIRTGA